MYKITLLPGDGIGPDVINEAKRILKVIEDKYKLVFEYIELDIGGVSIDKYGCPLTEENLDKIKNTDAVLLGAIGGHKWESLDFSIRPERALLKLRKELGTFANLRPIKSYSVLTNASPLKEEVVDKVDLVIVRELIGDLYFGEPRGIIPIGDGQFRGINTLSYTSQEIRRIARIAFKIAKKREKRLVSVDKANVLESTELWRRIVNEVHNEYPQIELQHMYVDNCAMQLLKNPKQFDVILTTNMFGDILSDEASMISGSLGMLGSASIGNGIGIFEPAHGSAPDLTGKDKANPIAMILSLALMFEHSFNMTQIANRIECSVLNVLNKGYRTEDIFEKGKILVGTKEMGELIAKELEEV